jgi:hypothetical protein
MADIFQCLRYSSAALEASKIVKASKGILVGLAWTNTNGATRYLQVFDSATLPADATIPMMIFPLATGQTMVLTVPGVGIPFQNGIVVCNSSTMATKTIGAADSLFQILYA